MKTTLTLLSSTAFALNALAQPTLTHATNAPVIGTAYTLHYTSTYLPPGSAGAAQSWDLSGLDTDSVDVLQLVAPSTTTNGAQFPGATIAELSDPVVTYYQVTPAGIHFAGSDDGTSLIVNAPVPRYLPFPCTMGTTWSTPYAAEFAYDDQPVHRSGTVSGTADGYGTLTMPWGTVPNVLRIHLVHVLQDSLSLFTMDYTYDSYLYYVPGQPHPIAELVTATIDMGFGTPDTVQFARWTEATSTGIDRPGGADHQISAYPNPTHDVVNIVVTEDMGTTSSATLLSRDGRIVHQERLVAFAGNTAQLDLRHLAPGLYTLVIVDLNGVRATAQLTLQ